MRIAIVAVALALAPAAYAQNNLHNNQWNGALITSDTNGVGHEVHGNATFGSLAGGNAFSSTLNGNINLSNAQRFWGDSRANTNVHLGGVGGTLNATSRAFSNSADIDAATACCININNFQAAQIDPTANTIVKFGGVGGDANIGATAFSNGLNVNGSGYAHMNIHTAQMNAALTAANANVAFGGVRGNLTVGSTAIANNVSFNNLIRH